MKSIRKRIDEKQLLDEIIQEVVPKIVVGALHKGESLDYKIIHAFLASKLNGKFEGFVKNLRNCDQIKGLNWSDETWDNITNNPKVFRPISSIVVKAIKNIGFETSQFDLTNNVHSIYPPSIQKKQKKEKGKPLIDPKWVGIEKYLSDNYDFRNNIVAHVFEYRKKSDDEFIELNENSLYRSLQINGITFSLTNIKSLLQSDFVPEYDPLKAYFTTLTEWDGTTDHIEKLANYVTAKDQRSFNHHLKKAFVRCVACAFILFYYNKQAFILVGQLQNTGKSTFIRFLCPPALAKYISENMSTDKDALMCLSENFIINLDELAILDKKEINYIKSLLSKDRVKVRRPFATRATTDARRASFFGSSNNDDFLTDETGSVRWLCFDIESIDFAYSVEVNIDMVWAQAYKLFLDGFDYELTIEEVKENEHRNEEFQHLTLEHELLQKTYQPGTADDHFSFNTATDILNDLCDRYPNVRALIRRERIGKALIRLGYSKASKKKEGQRFSVYGYYVKLNE